MTGFGPLGWLGLFPVACCFVLARCLFLLLAARQVYASDLAAAISLACFVLNPNVLYLATIPMTEIVFLAALFLALLAGLKFRASRHPVWAAVAVVASWTLSLTRYDGWFLIPFLAAWIASFEAARQVCVFRDIHDSYVLRAALLDRPQLVGNGQCTGFLQRSILRAGDSRIKIISWLSRLALQPFTTTPRQARCAPAGRSLFSVQLARGLLFGNAAMQALLFLFLTPLFYIWSMHSSGGTPIYIPPLWPFSYYNSRYGIAVVPLCALACGAIVTALPTRTTSKLALLLPAVCRQSLAASSIARATGSAGKSLQVNSVDRRAWTAAASSFLEANYQPGQGILTSTGDVTGIYCRSRIHLSETINIGNGPTWFLATLRPDLFHPAVWVIMQDGDPLSRLAWARAARPMRM